MKTSSLYVRRITISAILLGISLVIKTMFSFYIPLFGQNGVSVGISGIFSIMPSLLFGPVYGAVVSGLADLLGYLLKPMGAYLPLMTLVAALGGFLRGALWRALQNRDSRKLRIAVLVCSIVLLAVGIGNALCLSADGVDGGYYLQTAPRQTDKMHLISRMLIARTIGTKNPAANLATYITFVTAGVIGSAVLGMLLLLADFLISRKVTSSTRASQIPRLLIAMVLPGLVVTTLNTVILRETIYASWQVLPFSIVWIPRVAEEILGNIVKAYFVALLLGVFNRSLRTFSGSASPTDGSGAKE